MAMTVEGEGSLFSPRPNSCCLADRADLAFGAGIGRLGFLVGGVGSRIGGSGCGEIRLVGAGWSDLWLAGLACMFSTSVLLQILACALYNNWWPMLAALMYIIVPMPCLFFGDGSTRFLSSGEGGAWMKAAKFLTGMSAMGSLAIPAILRHAGLIETGAMFIEFTSFFILVCTVLCFHRATLDEEW
ncbi:hypothetical protein VPH35_063811 [Triticum aestivum]|uniref:Vacuolar protein sorting-associated protein 55-like protein n=1 Tax=Aegilops tauschii TaxID=37682 RepID=N1QU36_AEGTA